MKKFKTALATVFILAGFLGAEVVSAQQRFSDLRAKDFQAGFNGSSEVFEHLMKTIEQALAADPNNAVARVTHGIGVLRRSGDALQKGDAEASGKLYQAAIDEMEQAVQLAPDDVRVRVPRGSILLAASRFMPPQMGGPLMESGVRDFEKVLELQERDRTFSKLSVHQRGELLTGLGDGWARIGNDSKARIYFDRIVAEMEGTIYAKRAQSWLEGNPESKSPTFFACSGCHTE